MNLIINTIRKGVVVLTLLLMLASVTEANQVGFVESRVNGIAGQSITLHLIGSGFSAGPDRAGFSMAWDDSLLEYSSNEVANPPWDSLTVTSPSIGSGLLDVVLLGNSFGNVGSDFEIASFTFKVLDTPHTNSALISLADIDGGWTVDGHNVNVDYLNSRVQVVPLPAAIWLFGAGLAGIMGPMKRRK